MKPLTRQEMDTDPTWARLPLEHRRAVEATVDARDIADAEAQRLRGEVAMLRDALVQKTEQHTQLQNTLTQCESDRDVARAFKSYVHKRLDDVGVPADPEPEANEKHGCRIEGRLNYVLGDRDAAVAELVEARAAASGGLGVAQGGLPGLIEAVYGTLRSERDAARTKAEAVAASFMDGEHDCNICGRVTANGTCTECRHGTSPLLIARAGEKAAQADRAAWQAEAQKAKAEVAPLRERITQLEGALDRVAREAEASGHTAHDAYGILARAALRTPAAPDAIATWPWVMKFAALMEAKLEKNRHKGNREGWINDAASALLKRLDEEVAELWKAYRTGRISEMPNEAADVANFAMMIADVVGGLDESQHPRGSVRFVAMRCQATDRGQCENTAMQGKPLCWQHGGDMVPSIEGSGAPNAPLPEPSSAAEPLATMLERVRVETERGARAVIARLAPFQGGPLIEEFLRDRWPASAGAPERAAIPVCKTCGDTHSMTLGDRDVMCTHCPTPCEKCQQKGRGPYCETTPCACACHSGKAPQSPDLVAECGNLPRHCFDSERCCCIYDADSPVHDTSKRAPKSPEGKR